MLGGSNGIGGGVLSFFLQARTRTHTRSASSPPHTHPAKAKGMNANIVMYNDPFLSN